MDLIAKMKADIEAQKTKKEEYPLVDKLQSIGVNPPKPEPEDEASPTDKTQPEPPQRPQKPLKECPTCGKQLKVLAKHKCKAAKPATLAQKLTDLDPNLQKEDCIENIVKPSDVAVTINGQKVSGIQTVNGNNLVSEIVEDLHKIGFDLYINAVPTKGKQMTNTIHLCDIIKPIIEAIQKENQVEHWNIIDYAKGSGILAAKLERWIDQAKPTGIILLDSSTAEGKACKEVLRKYADNVVQGVF